MTNWNNLLLTLTIQGEIANSVKCHTDYWSQSNHVWTTWHYIIGFNRWKIMWTKSMTKLVIRSCIFKYTGVMNHHFRPNKDSVGMKLYNMVHQWYGQFTNHPQFKEKVSLMHYEETKTSECCKLGHLVWHKKVKQRDYADDPDHMYLIYTRKLICIQFASELVKCMVLCKDENIGRVFGMIILMCFNAILFRFHVRFSHDFISINWMMDHS